jgi:hypothetical protein
MLRFILLAFPLLAFSCAAFSENINLGCHYPGPLKTYETTLACGIVKLCVGEVECAYMDNAIVANTFGTDKNKALRYVLGLNKKPKGGFFDHLTDTEHPYTLKKASVVCRLDNSGLCPSADVCNASDASAQVKKGEYRPPQAWPVTAER